MHKIYQAVLITLALTGCSTQLEEEEQDARSTLVEIVEQGNYSPIEALRELQAQDTLQDVSDYFLAGGGLFTLIGGGALMVGALLGMASLKRAGGYGLAVGVSLMSTPIFLPTIIMQPWFSYTAGIIALLSLAYTAYAFQKDKQCLTNTKTSSK